MLEEDGLEHAGTRWIRAQVINELKIHGHHERNDTNYEKWYVVGIKKWTCNYELIRIHKTRDETF